MDIFEKQQNIETIKTVVAARWFFVALAVLQVMLLKLVVPGLSLTSGPIAVGLMAFAFSFNIFYWLYLRRSPEEISSLGLQTVKIMQIIVDELTIAAMLYLNGTVNSISTGFFLVAIMVGSALYQRKGVLLAGLLAGLLYSGLATLEYYGLFIFTPNMQAVNFFGLEGDLGFLKRNIISFNMYLLATAIFAAYIAGLFRAREKRLEAQRDELLKKTDTLTQSTDELTKTKNWLNEALIKSDKIRLEVDEARGLLEVEKNKVDAIIQNLTAGLIMINQRGEISLINGEATKMFKVKKEEIIGQQLGKLKAGNFKNLYGLIYSEANYIRKKEMTLSGEPERIFSVSTAPVVDSHDKILGQLIVLDDITREKAIDRLKTEFVTIAAHQLRTPLSAVKWALSLVLDRDLGKINEKQKDTLQQGYQSNERMINLINDLLNVARIEEGRFLFEFSKVSFEELVRQALEDFQPFLKIKGIAIKLEKPKDDKLEVMVDVEKMRLALQNLIENAVNYSPNNSAVTISFKRDKMDLVSAIKDEGMGIPKNQQSRVFSKFFRGDNAIKMETEGTGLGLFITKNIIESHGGKIWFETEEGKGTTVFFSLPLLTEKT